MTKCMITDIPLTSHDMAFWVGEICHYKMAYNRYIDIDINLDPEDFEVELERIHLANKSEYMLQMDPIATAIRKRGSRSRVEIDMYDPRKSIFVMTKEIGGAFKLGETFGQAGIISLEMLNQISGKPPVVKMIEIKDALMNKIEYIHAKLETEVEHINRKYPNLGMTGYNYQINPFLKEPTITVNHAPSKRGPH